MALRAAVVAVGGVPVATLADAELLALSDRLINAIAKPTRASTMTVATIATPTRQSGGLCTSVWPSPHSRHHS